MPEAILRLESLAKRFGEAVTAEDISLQVGRGEFFTLLGPSGSGKSTILRMIAGLERPDSGRIVLGDIDVTETPPWRRHLGMVFQQYANFPHMNVEQNVAYGLRRSGLSRRQIAERVSDLLRLVGLQGFQKKSVVVLSGGEQQRVAVARALAPEPTLLLLDEPMAALDEKIRREMQLELKHIQRASRTTFIYVTHDQEEALTMSDRIAVLNRGRMVQCDHPERVFRRPRTRFVASFFRGCNVLEGAVGQEDGRRLVRLGGAAAEADGYLPQHVRSGGIPIAIRGEALRLAEQARGCQLELGADLVEVTYRGLYSDYRLRLDDGQELTATLTHAPGLEPGQRVAVGAQVDDLVFLEPDEAA